MSETLPRKRKRDDDTLDEQALNPNLDGEPKAVAPVGTVPVASPMPAVPVPALAETKEEARSEAMTVVVAVAHDAPSDPVKKPASAIQVTTPNPTQTEKADKQNNVTYTNTNMNMNTKIDTPKANNETEVNSYTNIRQCIVENDGKRENLIRLIGLKNLFSKQLPKMPKDYIVRLVFDKRHTSLAILSDDPKLKGTDDEIMGAICYRSYHEMRFAEIAFCAVSQAQQVKGYGTKLMNLLKMHMVTEGIEYFITYADNYATGYFKKQGFSRTITMPKSRFHGLIKDYDGGTLMECYVHPSIDYTRIPEMIKAQRQFILDRIRTVSKSDKIIYPPLPKGWTPNRTGHSSRGNEAAVRAMAIPGMAEAGWTMADLLASTAAAKDNDRQRNFLKSEMLGIVRKIEEQHFAWPFREPVDTSEVKDYLEVIKDPIDLSTIEKRIRKGSHYKSKKELYNDMRTLVNNCKTYNDATSPYYECATNLDKYIKTLFVDV